MSAVRVAVTSAVTMFTILDPLGNVPTFLALSGGLDDRRRARAANQAVALAAAVILTFALVGRAILEFVGVTLPSLEVSGGILLGLVALKMLEGHFDDPGVAEHGNVALVPLGTPLIAGPGAVAATMVLVDRHQETGARAGVFVGLAVALAIVWAALRLAIPIGRRLSESAIHLLSRIMGLLLAAIAVELVFSGAREWIRLYG